MVDTAAFLCLDDIVHDQSSVRAHWSVDRHRFEAAVRYSDVDLDALWSSIGETAWQRTLFHIALFEMSKGMNLRPQRLDLR